MTTQLDTEFGQAALDLLNEFGKLVTITHVTPGVYNTATATLGGSTTASVNVRAIIEDYTLKGQHLPESAMSGVEYGQGALSSGNKKVTVAALGLTLPVPTDTVTFDGSTLTVIGVETTYSGDDACLYVLRCIAE